MKKQIFIGVFFVIALSWMNTCLCENTTLKTTHPTTRKCILNKIRYEEGDRFQHNFKGCLYNCTCAFKDDGNAFGNCSRRCPPFSIPPGCKPKTKCGCSYSYTCPPGGEKCKDESTGKLYQVGQKWGNGSCSCVCLGKQRGFYQCQCLRTHSVPSSAVIIPSTCVRNVTAKCFSCPNRNCALKRRCDQWPYIHRSNGKNFRMMCTCYGPNGYTRCVSSTRISRTKRSASLLSTDLIITSKSTVRNYIIEEITGKVFSMNGK